MFNPFSKKEPSQSEMIKDEHNFSEDQNILSGNLPQGAEDEKIFLEQREKHADLVKWQQDLTVEAQQLIHDLKREVMVGDDVWQTLEGVEPLANDLFVMDLLSFARPYLSKNMMMSNYSETRILNNLKATLFSLRTHLLQNRVKYKIKRTDMEYIVRLFKNTIDATPFRSLQNGERKFLGGFAKRIEMHSDRPIQPKKSMFGMGG